MLRFWRQVQEGHGRLLGSLPLRERVSGAVKCGGRPRYGERGRLTNSTVIARYYSNQVSI